MDIARYSEVLKQLDEQASPLKTNFPAFGTAFYYVDSRATVFSDGKRWGIVVETIEVNPNSIGHDQTVNHVYHYGNYPLRPVKSNENRYYVLTDDGSDGFVFGENNTLRYVIPTVKTIQVRGYDVPIPRDQKFYEQKGIYLVDRKELEGMAGLQAFERGIVFCDKEKIYPAILLRALTPEYRDHFFLSDEQKQTEFLYPIPKLLQLEEWRHPAYDESNILEPPSQCEAFQMIAKVIATCDPSEYKPTEKPNTHWRNWLVADYYL